MNLFQNSAKTVPMKADDQTIRVDLDVNELGGRKSHLPATDKSGALTISHVPNAGSTIGGK